MDCTGYKLITIVIIIIIIITIIIIIIKSIFIVLFKLFVVCSVGFSEHNPIAANNG